MIKGSPNLLIVGPGLGLWSSYNAIWWNLAIFFYVQAGNRAKAIEKMAGRVSG